MDLDRFFDQTASLLDEPVMILATVSPANQPHAAAVYFAACRTSGGLDLYYFSDPTSQHSRDLSSNPNAGGEIHPPGSDWRSIHGLQLSGVVAPVQEGSSWDDGWGLYAAKFPFVKGLRAIVARNALYRFRTRWLRLIDNRRGFGFKTEWQFP